MKLYAKYIFGTVITLLISITALLGYQYMKQSSQTAYKTNIIYSKILEQQNNLSFVTAIGRIEPRTKVVHLTASPAIEGARLAQLLVKEGDYVKPGQVVAILDSEQRLQSVVVEAEQQVEVARAKLAQVAAGVKVGEIAAQEAVLQKLEAAHQHAVSELERSEKLYRSGDIAEYELNNRRLAITTIAKEITQNQAVLQTLKEVRQVDIKLAQAEIKSLQASLGRAHANLELASVRSVTGGCVLKIHIMPGEVVNSSDSKGIVEIGETDQMYAIAEVFEADIQRVEVGQVAELKIRTTDQKLSGRVESIGLQIGKRNTLDSDPIADLDSRVIEVRISLDPRDSLTVSRLTNLRVDVKITASNQFSGGRK